MADARHPRLQVEPRKDGALLAPVFAAGDVLRTYHLKRKGDGGSEHQQRIDRCGMREAEGQAGGP